MAMAVVDDSCLKQLDS